MKNIDKLTELNNRMVRNIANSIGFQAEKFLPKTKPKSVCISIPPSESLFNQAQALENIQAGDVVDIIMDEKGSFKLRKAVKK